MQKIPVLKICYINTSDILPYENNAKQHSDDQVSKIKSSIETFGDCDPIGVWKNASGLYEIVEGHGRFMALKDLGYESIPAIILDHLSDEERRAYALAHNQLTLLTGFDESILSEELACTAEFDMSQFGFDSGIDIDGFDVEFTLPEQDAPNGKTMSLHFSQEQYDLVVNALELVSDDEITLRGGNSNGDKVCEVMTQWAAQRTFRSE